MYYFPQIFWYLFWIASIYLSYRTSLYAIKLFEKKYNPTEEMAEPVEK